MKRPADPPVPGPVPGPVPAAWSAASPPTGDARLRVLRRARDLKMAGSTHAYVRGSTARFYEWLALSPVARHLPDGPPVWICGDCHLGNLGPVADMEGHIALQIRDLDQTVIGNPAHDLIRLGLSLASVARGSDLPGVTTALMVQALIDGYARAMADPDAREGEEGELEAAPEPSAVRAVRRRALGRRWKHLAHERLKDVRPSIPLGRKFWALDDAERAGVEALFGDEGVRRTLVEFNGRAPDDNVELLDAAYWVKGCSSLGTLRYAALVRVGKPKHGQLALVDLKEAVAPIAPAVAAASMPPTNAERVVTGARALSPNLGERMRAVALLGRPVVLRELMPQDLKLEVAQFTSPEATRAARYLAYVVGLAHARQLDAPARRAWRAELVQRRGGGLEAPPWLWQAVVDLTATHEAAYLEHCRRFALEEAQAQARVAAGAGETAPA